MTDDPDQSTFRAHFLRVCAWVVIGALGYMALPFVIGPQIDRAAHQARVEVLKAKFANEYDEADQKLRVKGREADARRKAEFEQALGGKVPAAFRNPAHNIAEALRQGAIACAPAECGVQVEADRFTEFTVTISSARPLATNQMVAFARAFLPHAREYLEAVRFSVGPSVIAELDRADIESIEDWDRIPERRIAALLAPEVPTAVAQDETALQNLKEEQRLANVIGSEPGLRERIEKADLEFRQTTQNAYEHFRLALDMAQKAARVGDVRSLADIDAHEKQLREATEHLKEAREFWTDPAGRWIKELASAKVNPEAQELLRKTLPASYRKESERFAKVFPTADGLIESTRYLFALLIENQKKWSFASGNEGIALNDPDFAKQFQKAQQQVFDDYAATVKTLQTTESP